MVTSLWTMLLFFPPSTPYVVTKVCNIEYFVFVLFLKIAARFRNFFKIHEF